MSVANVGLQLVGFANDGVAGNGQKYKRGSKPEHPISQAEVDEIRSLLFETINQTKADLNSKIFKTYTEFTTLSGFTMRNVEDALAFNYYHEAMHIGMMMSIRKFI